MSTSTEVLRSRMNINEEQQPNTTKFTCYRNLMVVSFTYAFVLTGVTCIANVQSSLNSEEGLGTASLGVQTATMIIQALFFNAIALTKLGLKWCISIGIVLEAVYVAGNIYPTWYTLVPAAAVSGFGRPLMKTADAIYLIKIATVFAQSQAIDVQSTKTKFFYVYYVIYCSSRVFGSIATSLILGSGFKDFDLSLLSNTVKSNPNYEKDTEYCGAKFCNHFRHSVRHGNMSFDTDMEKHTDIGKVYSLCVFSFACMVIAFIVNVLFLQPVEKIAKSDHLEADELEEGFVTNPCMYLLNTIKSWRNPWQLLLIPLSTYNGIDNAFMTTDFSSAFVTCYFGVQWVGFVIAWYGLTSPITVFIASFFSNKKFRSATFILAFSAHLSVCITLLTWVPNIHALPILFVLSAVWGVGSGLWPTILSAFYGVIFTDNLEAAFSNMWLFDSIGALLTYSWGSVFCTTLKIAIYTTFLVTGIIGYLVVEVQLQLRNSKISSAKKSEENLS